jgi:hypothetical protein
LINQARTPSETLMSALAECETAEQVLIIMRHGEDISWHGSSASRVDVLGMIDFVQTCIRAKIAAEEKGDDL